MAYRAGLGTKHVESTRTSKSHARLGRFSPPGLTREFPVEYPTKLLTSVVADLRRSWNTEVHRIQKAALRQTGLEHRRLIHYTEDWSDTDNSGPQWQATP